MSEELDPDRPIRYERDGNVYYRASALGACDRALVAASMPLSYPPREHPEWFTEVLNEGKRMEDRIDAWWVEKCDGIPTVEKQRRMTLLVAELDWYNVYVEGSIDGMRDWPEMINHHPTIREYKKFRPSTYPRFLTSGVEIQSNYPWQVSAYMHAFEQETCTMPDMEFVGVRYNPDTDMIEDGKCHLLTGPPIPLKAIRKKLLMVESKIVNGYDPKEVACPGDKYPCPWWYIHDFKPKAELPVGVLPATPELLALVAEYQHCRVQAADHRKSMDAADNASKAAREQLFTLMRQAGFGPGSVVAVGDTGDALTWTETPREGYPVKATTIVKLTHGAFDVAAQGTNKITSNTPTKAPRSRKAKGT